MYLPANNKTQIKENKKYNSIKSCLTSHVSKTRLLFISYLCRSIFDKFLTIFQKSSPMIHLLYEELSNVYRMVLLSFLVFDHVGNKQGAELLLIDHKLAGKQLNNKEIKIGERALKLKIIDKLFSFQVKKLENHYLSCPKMRKKRFFKMYGIFFIQLLHI